MSRAIWAIGNPTKDAISNSRAIPCPGKRRETSGPVIRWSTVFALCRDWAIAHGYRRESIVPQLPQPDDTALDRLQAEMSCRFPKGVPRDNLSAPPCGGLFGSEVWMVAARACSDGIESEQALFCFVFRDFRVVRCSV